jgi:hypothetical protein
LPLLPFHGPRKLHVDLINPVMDLDIGQVSKLGLPRNSILLSDLGNIDTRKLFFNLFDQASVDQLPLQFGFFAPQCSQLLDLPLFLRIRFAS